MAYFPHRKLNGITDEYLFKVSYFSEWTPRFDTQNCSLQVTRIWFSSKFVTFEKSAQNNGEFDGKIV